MSDRLGLPLRHAGHYISSVARSPRHLRGSAALFESEPYAAVVRVLQEAGTAINAAEIKQILGNTGVAALDRNQWSRLQRRLRTDDHVLVDQRFRYLWVEEPTSVSPADALRELIRIAGARAKPSHVEVVRQALDTPPNELEVAAQHRHAVRNGLRLLAELASEVEELAVSQASARALIHRVRSRVRLSDLEPIERAGDVVTFDRTKHQPIGGSIADGAQVRVVRPGYSLRTPGEEVVLARAAVLH